MLDGTAAIDENADLPSDLPTELGQLAGEVLRQQLIGANTAPEQALKPTYLEGLEAVRVAEDVDRRLL